MFLNIFPNILIFIWRRTQWSLSAYFRDQINSDFHPIKSTDDFHRQYFLLTLFGSLACLCHLQVLLQRQFVWLVKISRKKPTNDNSVFLSGALISFMISTLVYYFYEEPYLKLSPLPISILIIFLIGSSLILDQSNFITRETNYEEKYNIYGLNLSEGDPSKNLCKSKF